MMMMTKTHSFFFLFSIYGQSDEFYKNALTIFWNPQFYDIFLLFELQIGVFSLKFDCWKFNLKCIQTNYQNELHYRKTLRYFKKMNFLHDKISGALNSV